MAARGEAWWGPAPFKSTTNYRPWLVISDDSHPFASEECIALAMSTQRHDGSIAVAQDDWIDGGSDVDSFISPWYVNTIKLRAFDNRQGTLAPALVTEAVEALHGFTPAMVE